MELYSPQYLPVVCCVVDPDEEVVPEDLPAQPETLSA